jgi:hypothetical protein
METELPVRLFEKTKGGWFTGVTSAFYQCRRLFGDRQSKWILQSLSEKSEASLQFSALCPPWEAFFILREQIKQHQSYYPNICRSNQAGA